MLKLSRNIGQKIRIDNTILLCITSIDDGGAKLTVTGVGGDKVHSCKVGDSFMIGKEVAIYLKNTRNGQAKIGLVAPNSIPILREELYQRKHPKEQTTPPGDSSKWDELINMFHT